MLNNNERMYSAIEIKEVEGFGNKQVIDNIEKIVYGFEIDTTQKTATINQINYAKNLLLQKVYPISIPKEILSKLEVINNRQITHLINTLKGVSFISQREQLAELLKRFKETEHEDYKAILDECKKVYWNIDWFIANKNLVNGYNQFLGCTEIQANQLIRLSRYAEVQIYLKNTYDINIMDYEVRPNSNTTVGGSFSQNNSLAYKLDKDNLKIAIMTKVSREDASSMLQAFSGYANAIMLTNEELNRLRSLYIQLGDIEGTRPSHLYSIKHNDFYAYEKALMEELSKQKQGQFSKDTPLIKALRKRLDGQNVNEYFNSKHHVKIDKVSVSAETEITNLIHNLFAMCGERADQNLLNLPYESKEFRKQIREKIKDAKKLGSFSYEVLDDLSQEALDIIYPELA